MPETETADTVLHHAPRTRALTALWLLEELELPYRLAPVDLSAGVQRQDDFLAINPMGKVPVVVHRGVPVSELGAIAIYLSDLEKETVDLAPALEAPERAAYLRWIFFATAIVEPALGEKFFKWDVPSGSVAWGSFDRMLRAAQAGLRAGPYALGRRFTAADVILGSAMRFATLFGAIPKDDPVIGPYVTRVSERAAFARAGVIEKRELERRAPPAT